ncbi:uncharacterized protein LOC133359375 isoform X2 [Lethenteron reissneri]|uniref:uncharacterized protein LOC133359375 isoform X2 n=1 Tax=Lethenteron reissneri TaxID=7753 RepID=UPI002AB7D101|nr:uncharacterized protein LOC133359375 isoform X2 [Lethenteron reissneri]
MNFMTKRRSSPGLALRGTILLMVCCALQEPSAAKECGDGFYKTPRGVCCRLCPAGTFKVKDCTSDGRKALCDLCPKGTFLHRDNQDEKCSWCSSCGSGEEVAVNCSVAQDTMCRCMERLKRDGDSGICLPEETHSDTPTNYEHDENLSLVHIMRNEHKVPFGVQRSNDSSDTMQLIQENKENLKTWIGTDPSAFLEHLNGLNLIPRRVHQAAVDKGGEESVELVLDHCISQGESGCEKLWDALYSVRKQYVQLWMWIQKHGEALRAIRDKESDLKLWIAKDPKHLLLLLMSRGRISNELFTEAKSIRDGAECAELLLKYFIERGNDDCLRLLFAVQAVRDEYPGVKEWLEGLGFLRRLSTCPVDLNSYSENFLRDKIRFQTRKLLLALRDDLTPLVSQLHIRNILTDNSVREVKRMQARQGSEKATQHMVELVMARGRPRVKQFWEALWDLRESYPDLKDIFEKF